MAKEQKRECLIVCVWTESSTYHYPAFIKRIYAGLVPLLTRFPGANSVSRSGSNLAWLVHHAQENDLFGRYVSNRFPRKSSRESYTPGIGSDVWTTCCLAAGIDPSSL